VLHAAQQQQQRQMSTVEGMPQAAATGMDVSTRPAVHEAQQGVGGGASGGHHNHVAASAEGGGAAADVKAATAAVTSSATQVAVQLHEQVWSVASATDQELAQALQQKHGSSSSLQGIVHEPLPSGRPLPKQAVRSPLQRQQEAQAFRLQMLQGRALQDLQASLQQVAAALTASRHPWQREQQHPAQETEHPPGPSCLQLQPEASVASSSCRQEQELEQTPQACQEVVQKVQEQQLPAMTRDQLHKWLKRKHEQLGSGGSSGSRSPTKSKGSLAVALRAPPSATWPQRVTGAVRLALQQL